jgi:putative Mg2+ transporter-C (MgtC) family protein
MPIDVVGEVTRVGLLILAAALGAIVGAQREMHGSPAGVRTHLLVAFGSGLFTIVSATGFLGQVGPADQHGATAYDPTRIAAQVVAGIGFLGAGAILKEGATIRGLTTAASLWTAAAIGMAVGAGEVILAIAGTIIILVSLGPLGRVSTRLAPQATRQARVLMKLRSIAIVDMVVERLANDGIDVLATSSEPLKHGKLSLDITVRLTRRVTVARVMAAILGVDGVESAQAQLPADEG